MDPHPLMWLWPFTARLSLFSPQELGLRVCVPQGPSLLRMHQVFRKRVTALSVLLVITAGQSNDGDAQLLPVLPKGQFPWVERPATQARVSLYVAPGLVFALM